MSDFRSVRHQFGGRTGPLVRFNASPVNTYWRPNRPAPVSHLNVSDYTHLEEPVSTDSDPLGVDND